MKGAVNMKLINYYENSEILSINKQEDHSYFIPQLKTSKKNVIDLNGKWDFKYYENVELFDFNETSFDTIPVPSCWQIYGFDKNQYINVRYPFPFTHPMYL